MSTEPIHATCPFCKEPSSESFRARVMGRHDAVYATCGACGSLHVVSPTWLDEAYANAAWSDEACDTGAEWRNRVLVGLMMHLGVDAPLGPWLDYGSGRGLLVKEIASRGIAIRPHDPPRGIFAPREYYAMVSAFEVLEHQVDPVAMLREIYVLLAASGIVVMSTWLRDPSHGPAWPYLALEAGQHVSFPTLAGLRRAFTSAGLSWWCSGAQIARPELQVHLGGLGPVRGVEALESSGFRVFARS